MGSSILFEHGMQVLQGILDRVPFGFPCGGEDDFPVKGIDLEERPCPEKAVSTNSFTPDDAFEEERVFFVLQSAVRADGSQGIADQLPKNGYEIHSFGQLPKSGEVGRVSSHVVEILFCEISRVTECEFFSSRCNGIGSPN